MKKIILYNFLFIVLFLQIVSAVDFVPGGNIVGRNVYNITNFSNINAVRINQNGNQVLDTSNLSSLSSNYSKFSNYSNYCGEANYWDNLGTYSSTYFYNNAGVFTFNESSISYLNDTALINAVNTTSNIMGLGFYNNTYSDSRFMNITDQRYNDTDLINAVNTTSNIINLGFYNGTYINDTYLLQLDQRYNDTDLINAVNTTYNIMSLGFYNSSYTQGLLDLKLNESDQRYNDTDLINAVNTTSNIISLGFYNSSYIDTSVCLTNGSNCNYTGTVTSVTAGSGLLGGTITTSGTIDVNDTYFEVYNDTNYINSLTITGQDPVSVTGNFTENFTVSMTQAGVINSGYITNLDYILFTGKLDAGDQRYNDTALINAVNDSLINYYNKTEIDLQMNDKLNVSDQRYNDTDLINAVNTTTNIMGLGFFNATESIANFVNRSLWTSIDDYPSACSVGNYVTAIGDTLTCSVPAGTTYTAGTGLELSTTTFSVNDTYLQIYNDSLINTTSNIMSLGFYNSSYTDSQYLNWTDFETLNTSKTGIGNCGDGEFVQNLTASGPQCSTAGGSGTVTEVTRGFGFEDNGTSITSTGTLNINTTVFQIRQLNSCTYGVSEVLENGTATCVAQQGTVTSIEAGTGLTGGTITTSGTIALNTTYTDSIYARLDSNNNFTANLTIQENNCVFFGTGSICNNGTHTIII